MNCQGLANEEWLTDLENALDKINYHIVGLSEKKRKAEFLQKIKSGNIFYFFGESVGYWGGGVLYK